MTEPKEWSKIVMMDAEGIQVEEEYDSTRALRNELEQSVMNPEYFLDVMEWAVGPSMEPHFQKNGTHLDEWRKVA